VSGPIRPEVATHGARRPATHGQPKGWLSLGLAARFGGDATRGVGVAHSWRGHRTQLARVTVWWRAHRYLSGGWQGDASEVARATGRAPGKAVGVELSRAAAQCGGGGGCFGRWCSSAGRELRWLAAVVARPCSVGAEEGR
jgi:hypothetical protein